MHHAQTPAARQNPIMHTETHFSLSLSINLYKHQNKFVKLEVKLEKLKPARISLNLYNRSKLKHYQYFFKFAANIKATNGELRFTHKLIFCYEW